MKECIPIKSLYDPDMFIQTHKSLEVYKYLDIKKYLYRAPKYIYICFLSVIFGFRKKL